MPWNLAYIGFRGLRVYWLLELSVFMWVFECLHGIFRIRDQKMTKSLYNIVQDTQIFGFLIPTHMCINTKIATSRSWTQVMARLIRDFTLLNDGHFKNGLKQVVHPNIFLWHPLLMLRSKKQRWSNIVYMLYKCFVFTGTASGPWTTTPSVNGHMWSCVISPRGTKWSIHHYSCLTF